MNRIRQHVFILSVMILVWFAMPAGYAEMLQGHVLAVDSDEQSVEVMLQGEAAGPERPLKIIVTEGAELKGCGSLDDLETGDKVRMHGVENRDKGLWEADSLELTES